jgi:hypothetical protein
MAMSEQPTKKGKVVSLGWFPDDDPIYQGRWNFLIGKNLNPKLKPTPDETLKKLRGGQVADGAGS